MSRMTEVVGQSVKSLKRQVIKFLKRGYAKMIKWKLSRLSKNGLRNPNVHAIITTGGTGIGFRDVTIETVTPYFTKKIDGFGELFRFLAIQRMLDRRHC